MRAGLYRPSSRAVGQGPWPLAPRRGAEASLARRRGPRARPYLFARSPGSAKRLPPSGLHALQTRDRTFSGPASCRNPAERLRSSNPALGHSRLSGGALRVDSREENEKIDRDEGADELADDRDN